MENIAVVITSQMTTKVMSDPKMMDCDMSERLVPGLGESHAHQINQRVVLCANERSGKFYAEIVKSLWRPKSTVEFQITTSGIK